MTSNIVDLHASSGETKYNKITRLAAEVEAWRVAARVLDAGISTPEGLPTCLHDLSDAEAFRSKAALDKHTAKRASADAALNQIRR
ncbi:hypothetical protein FHR70_001769 [Microvirga lupini]|uniref:Uncharacterized protein n=1 Tax=Microvirga lupini TaxID=420324 RepID=A0A7W4VK81_9HYPH|nr:hypothetical protein [Microvirga lupini]